MLIAAFVSICIGVVLGAAVARLVIKDPPPKLALPELDLWKDEFGAVICMKGIATNWNDSQQMVRFSWSLNERVEFVIESGMFQRRFRYIGKRR